MRTVQIRDRFVESLIGRNLDSPRYQAALLVFRVRVGELHSETIGKLPLKAGLKRVVRIPGRMFSAVSAHATGDADFRGVKRLAGMATSERSVIEFGVTSKEESIVVDDVRPYITNLPNESSAQILLVGQVIGLRVAAVEPFRRRPDTAQSRREGYAGRGKVWRGGNRQTRTQAAGRQVGIISRIFAKEGEEDMLKSRHTEPRMIDALKQVEAGASSRRWGPTRSDEASALRLEGESGAASRNIAFVGDAGADLVPASG
jgi:hypothetical protein